MPNVEQLEKLMRPGISSQGGFLGSEEKLVNLLAEDESAVKNLGITHEQIAARIEYFIRAVGYPSREGKVIDSNFRVSGITYRGIQECPWKDSGNYSNLDFVITNLRLNESLPFPGLIVHLIRMHHFYEGRKSPYRVDPELAARILVIK